MMTTILTTIPNIKISSEKYNISSDKEYEDTI